MILPELRLKEFLEELLKLIGEDFNKEDEKDTLFYLLFKETEYVEGSYLEYAKKIFLRQEDHPKELKVRMFYDPTRAKLPTIHITLPGEVPVDNGMGVDEGYAEATVNTTGDRITPTYTRRYSTTFGIIVTSENEFETIMIYHILKNLLTSATDMLNKIGFQNIGISGRDLQLNDGVSPIGVLVRALNFKFDYESQTPRFYSQVLMKSIEFKGKPLPPK